MIACFICCNKSSTTAICLYDSDTIRFYLFAKERAEIAMLLNKIHLTTK